MRHHVHLNGFFSLLARKHLEFLVFFIFKRAKMSQSVLWLWLIILVTELCVVQFCLINKSLSSGQCNMVSLILIHCVVINYLADNTIQLLNTWGLVSCLGYLIRKMYDQTDESLSWKRAPTLDKNKKTLIYLCLDVGCIYRTVQLLTKSTDKIL